MSYEMKFSQILFDDLKFKFMILLYAHYVLRCSDSTLFHSQSRLYSTVCMYIIVFFSFFFH